MCYDFIAGWWFICMREPVDSSWRTFFVWLLFDKPSTLVWHGVVCACNAKLRGRATTMTSITIAMTNGVAMKRAWSVRLTAKISFHTIYKFHLPLRALLSSLFFSLSLYFSNPSGLLPIPFAGTIAPFLLLRQPIVAYTHTHTHQTRVEWVRESVPIKFRCSISNLCNNKGGKNDSDIDNDEIGLSLRFAICMSGVCRGDARKS